MFSTHCDRIKAKILFKMNNAVSLSFNKEYICMVI